LVSSANQRYNGSNQAEISANKEIAVRAMSKTNGNKRRPSNNPCTRFGKRRGSAISSSAGSAKTIASLVSQAPEAASKAINNHPRR